jgi:hypothetical protein
MYLVVPLSFIGTHLVGLPAAGAFSKVPAAAAAPFVSPVVVVRSVALPCVIPPVVEIDVAPLKAPLIVNEVTPVRVPDITRLVIVVPVVKICAAVQVGAIPTLIAGAPSDRRKVAADPLTAVRSALPVGSAPTG